MILCVETRQTCFLNQALPALPLVEGNVHIFRMIEIFDLTPSVCVLYM